MKGSTMKDMGKTDKELRMEVWDQARILAFGDTKEQEDALKTIAHLLFVLQHTKELTNAQS